MIYRICLSVQNAFLTLEDSNRWSVGRVYGEYPELIGIFSTFVSDTLTSILRYPAPNMSVVTVPLTGSRRKDASPTGCHGSIHRNESDITFMPVDYPVQDYSKVDPIQVVHEGPLDILSTYKVNHGTRLDYADFLTSSVKSFDTNIWSLTVVSFFVFSVLLLIRHLIREEESHGYPVVFEVFSHMIGQESTDFTNRSGRVISAIMTIGFFFLCAFYFSLMSTDLFVITKPHPIGNYRDIMRENCTVGFLAALNDVSHFEKADKGSIQETFWKQFSTSHYMVDFNTEDQLTLQKFGMLMVNQEAVFVVSSLFSQLILETVCKAKERKTEELPMLGNTYGWLSSDPEGKQHKTGLIIRQGLNTELIIKGRRRLRGLFEGDVILKGFWKCVDNADLGPLTDGVARVTDVQKCIAKTVNYKEPENIEQVNVENLKYLNLVCLALVLCSFTVLVLEKMVKMLQMQFDHK